jgi:serine/threonine protein kinase
MAELTSKPEIALNESQGGFLDNPKDIHGKCQLIQVKKRILTPKQRIYKKCIEGPLRDLALPQVAKSATSMQTVFIVRHESPWDTFRKSYDCELGKTFEIASCKLHPSRLVAIRTIRERHINTILRLFKNIMHPNILSSRDCFVHELSIFAVYNYQDIEIILDNLISCKAYLNEVELAAVLAQVSHACYAWLWSLMITGRFSMACYISPVSG